MVLVNGGPGVNLVNFLVIVVSVLTILSALTLVFGSQKAERWRSLWFLAAAVGEVVWSVSIAGFLSLGTGEFDQQIAPWLVKGIYVGPIVMDAMLLGYVAWKYKFGKVATVGLLAMGAVLLTIFLYDPSVMYSSYTLANAGNMVTYLMPEQGGWFLIAYSIFFCMITPALCLALLYQIKRTTNRGMRRGYIFFVIGMAVGGFLSLIFDLIGAIYRYDLIWVGPLAIGAVLIGFYYAVLKYRMIVLATGWLKAMSTAVLACAGVIIYLLLFHVIFSALFQVANPSFQVLLLNFLMIAVVLLLTPAIIETWTMMRLLIMTKQIDVAYIVKKLSRLDRKKMNLKEVSGFLAEYMHYEYVGFLVNGRYYAGDDGKLSAETIEKVSRLKMPTRGIWQDVTSLGAVAKDAGILRVAAMADTQGEEIGQVVFGKPTTKATLDREDIARTEMVVNLIGTMIENGGRSKS